METTETTYGSDRTGLVWGYRFPPGESARPIDCDAAADLLASTTPGEHWFLWLHLSLSNTASERWLRQHLQLPQQFLDSFQEGVGATRVEQEDDWLVAVIHDVLFDFTFDPSDVSTVCLCVGPRILVSARPKPLRSVDGLRGSVKSGTRFRSPVELLASLLRDQANVLVEIVRVSTRRVDALEDKLLDNRVSMSRAELGSLRRVLVRLQRLLAPEPAALFRLLSRPPAWISEEDLQDLRQAAEEFSAVVADSAAVVERIRLLQEELAARIDEQNNRILFLLTVVTVLALPINLAAGLFGMNVGGIPLAQHRDGFLLITAIVVTIAAAGGVLAYRRRSR